jgi:hypothetical protein
LDQIRQIMVDVCLGFQIAQWTKPFVTDSYSCVSCPNFPSACNPLIKVLAIISFLASQSGVICHASPVSVGLPWRFGPDFCGLRLSIQVPELGLLFDSLIRYTGSQASGGQAFQAAPNKPIARSVENNLASRLLTPGASVKVFPGTNYSSKRTRRW